MSLDNNKKDSRGKSVVIHFYYGVKGKRGKYFILKKKHFFWSPVGGEGGVLVSVAELVAGVGRRDRRSMHQVLERQHRFHAQV